MKFAGTAVLALVALPAFAAPLPRSGPVPQPRPQAQEAQKPAEPAEKPEETGPLKGTVTTPQEQLVIAPETDADHARCLADLKALGAVFAEKPRVDDGAGCGIDKPLSLSTLPEGVKIQPEGVMSCKAALALSRWVKESVLPAAATAFPGKRLESAENASAYVCRLRNNASKGKISEHARGNAIDIAAFTLSGGERVDIRPRKDDSTLSGAFQRGVTATACLYFTTVLDPESDAAHERHLHLDVLERKGGYRYCR